MKRLCSFLAALLLIPCLCAGVQAAASAQIVRAFVSEGCLYTYVDLSGNEQPITKAEARIGSASFPSLGRLETVRQAGSPVSYLLLVDISNSMPPFQEDILAFASRLAENSGENTRFTLAVFGDGFEVAAEDIPPEELSQHLSALTYEEPITQLHSAIDAALDYFESVPWTGNELRSVIVLTDAVEYDPQGGVPYEELLSRIEQSDVMLHAVGFGGDEQALSSLSQLVSASDGSQWSIGSGLSAADAAGQLVDCTGRLFVVGFDLGEYVSETGSESVSITFSSGAELICRAQAQAALPTSEPAAESGQEPAPEPLPPSSGQASGSTPGGQPPAPDSSPSWLPLAAVGVLVLLAAGAVLLLVRRKKPVQPPAPAPAPGIYMRLEVLQGQLRAPVTDLNLTEELIVGRDPDCAISFDSPALSRRNTRIFTAGGAVYVEDLHSQNGTKVNGLPIEMPNLLRSGDEITAGDVSFRLKF